MEKAHRGRRCCRAGPTRLAVRPVLKGPAAPAATTRGTPRAELLGRQKKLVLIDAEDVLNLMGAKVAHLVGNTPTKDTPGIVALEPATSQATRADAGTRMKIDQMLGLQPEPITQPLRRVIRRQLPKAIDRLKSVFDHLPQGVKVPRGLHLIT